jgi:large subunit ribosomal protein L18
MNREKFKQRQRRRRRWRVRNRIFGTAERPRLAVFRSAKHIYAQVIDDLESRTLVAASSLEPALRDQLGSGGNKSAASEVGKLLAERAAEKGIAQVALDRRHYKYHGRVAALADAAREGGLKF